MTRFIPRFLLCLLAIGCFAACSERGDTTRIVPGSDSTERYRIVTLSPHLAELVFAVGAGEQLVGVSAYTDFPEQAAELPKIGDAFALDHERLTMLAPDILLAWQSGTPAHVIDELRERGHRVETIRTENVADISSALLRVGEITGTSQEAGHVAARFSGKMQAIADRYADAESISVFYQVSKRPLFTINNEHYVSDLITICGGRNVFADLQHLAPTISVESVLDRNPEVLLASSDAGTDAFVDWDRWPNLAANQTANRYILPADEIARATPRLIIAAIALCEALDRAREKRSALHE